MDGREIPLDLIDGEQPPWVQGYEHCAEAAVSYTQPVLSPVDVRSLADFFLLLDGWDRMSTEVTGEPAAPEQSAA